MERDRGGASGYGGDAGQVYAYDVEELEFKREGMRIAGRFFAPQGVARPCPTVIVCHGFGSSMERSADYAAAFARAGIAACVFDFIGGSWDSQSDGDMLHMSVLTEAADLNVVVDTLLARDDVDASRLVLMGGSQGGFVASYVAATRPSDVFALVAFYPAYVIQDDARKRAARYGDASETREYLDTRIGRIYDDDALSFDIYDMLPDYTGPVLIVHGTVDELVPLEYSKRALEAFANARLETLEGAGHGFNGTYREQAAQLAVAFVQEQLRGQGGSR